MIERQLILNLRKDVPDNKELAELHIRFGFVNSPVVIQYRADMDKIAFQNATEQRSNEVVLDYEYYKDNYPKFTFIHQDDLDEFVKANNFKIVPAAEYEMDLSQETLEQLIPAETNILFDRDNVEDDYEMYGMSDKIKLGKILQKPNLIFSESEMRALHKKYNNNCTTLTESHLIYRIVNKETSGTLTNYDAWANGLIRHISKDGLFVLEQKIITKVRKWIWQKDEEKTLTNRDPLIFRYCRKGIQILNK